MLAQIHEKIDPVLIDQWQSRKHVSLDTLRRIAMEAGGDHASVLTVLNHAFHSSLASREALLRSASSGDGQAREMLDMLRSFEVKTCDYRILEDELFHELNTAYWADERGFLHGSREWYPKEHDGRKIGFRMDWVRRALSESAVDFQKFSSGKRTDTAVLVGNGPSLRHEDLSLLEGQDVFISNYAVKHPWLASIARGIAVSNAWITSQEPYWFHLAECWKFFPFWHGESVCPGERCIFLNAHGGDLFFSTDVTKAISWHSTVTYFWLQILYSAGYRKVLMVGIDNFYQQPIDLKEGDLIDQQVDDPNHFDPSYFRGRRWQAADTAKMQSTYAMAKEQYERDGREIVNCTTGGNLGLFRRSSLSRELCKPSYSACCGPSASLLRPNGPDGSREDPSRALCLIRGGEYGSHAPCGQNPVPGDSTGRVFHVEGRVSGRELVAIVGVRAPEGASIDIRFGPMEGEHVDSTCVTGFSASSGLHWMVARQVFSRNHGKLCVSAAGSGAANRKREAVAVEHMFVMESPGSIFNHLRSNSGLLMEANRLMVANQLMSCIPLYLHLAMIRPLDIYMSAARLSLSMLGVTRKEDQDALCRELGYIPHPDSMNP